MGCPTEVEIGDNLVFTVCTHDPDTGVLTDADSVPSYRVYEDETGTAILTGSMAKLDDANTTGFYSESIACTSGNGFENGKTYTVYIEATVDSDQGGICYGFKAYDVRKSNVSQISGDGTAADNIELAFDGTGYGFTGCTMPTVTTLTGHTAQTGDNYARLGAPAGASIAADIAENQTDLNTILGDTNELQTDWTDGGRLDLLIDAIKAKTDNQPAGIPKNVALSNFEFLMIDSTDHITPKTGLTVIGEISKDGGAFASLTNSVSEISNGVYKVNITQTEMNADVISLKFTGTGADQRTITIKTST